MKEELEKNIVVIGNTLVAEILSQILPEQYRIIKVGNDIEYVDMPYYPNDINDGILKQFAKNAQMENISNVKNIEVLVKVFTENSELQFLSGVWNFKEAIKSELPDYIVQIEDIFEKFAEIGNEWNGFIKNQFADGRRSFKTSSKYGMIEMKDIAKKFSLPEIFQEYLNVFIPKSDVTMSVYGGYLGTQLFDINVLDPCLVRTLHMGVKNNITYRIEHDLERFDTGMLGGNDFIVDCRNNKEEKLFHGGKAKCKILDGDMPANTVFYIKKVEFWCHIWNDSILQKDKDEWNVEYVLYDEKLELSDMEEKISRITRCKVTFMDCENDDVLSKKYGFSELEGFNWAFNKRDILEDPMNLVKKHKGNIIHCGKWGYAWFSAAYYIRSIVLGEE